MIDTRSYGEWFRYLSNTYDVKIERVAGWNHRVVFMDGQSMNFHRFDVDREQLERTIAYWSRHCNVEYFKEQYRAMIKAAQADGRSFRERYLVNPCKNVVVDYNT